MSFHVARELFAVLSAAITTFFLYGSFETIATKLSSGDGLAIIRGGQIVFAAVWFIAIYIACNVAGDYFAFQIAKYWLRRLWKMDKDPPEPQRIFFWAYVNFENWRRRAGKCLKDFGNDPQGEETIFSLPRLEEQYRLG